MGEEDTPLVIFMGHTTLACGVCFDIYVITHSVW